MGLFFQSSSWRKPLQLIECWLPEPSLTGRSAALSLAQAATTAAWPSRAASTRCAANSIAWPTAKPRADADWRAERAGYIRKHLGALGRPKGHEARGHNKRP